MTSFSVLRISTFVLSVLLAIVLHSDHVQAIGPLAFVGAASAIIGLASTPVFMASAANGLAVSNFKKGYDITIRAWNGQGEPGSQHEGEGIGANVFDVNGAYMGWGRDRSYDLNAGSFMDLNIRTENHNAPEYYLVSAGADEICLSAISFSWTGSSKPLLIMGDVMAQCGMPWYHSRASLLDTADTHPKCVWMSSRFPDKLLVGEAEAGTYFEGGLYHNGNIPGGFWIQPGAFGGDVVNDEVIEQRTEYPDLWCGHSSRFSVVDDIRGSRRFPVFADRPLPRNQDGTDVDPANFGGRAVIMSDVSQNMVRKRKRDNTTEDIPSPDGDDFYTRLSQTLWLTEQSARALCEPSTNSFGPDFYSYEEKMFCDMHEKRLVPACSSESTEDCFDEEMRGIRSWDCEGTGRMCKRKAHRKYVHYVDSKKGN